MSHKQSASKLAYILSDGAFPTEETEIACEDEKCYEIIEIEVLSKEETNDFLQKNEYEEYGQTNEFTNLNYFKFQMENDAENENCYNNKNVDRPNVTFIKNEKTKSPSIKKTVTRICAANCTYQCEQNISEKERKRIYEHFWKLSEKKQKLFYNGFIRHDQKNETKQNNMNFMYYLPTIYGTVQVCKWYFLSTLDIKEHQLEKELYFQEYDIQEVKDHICRCLADDHLSPPKMYMLYKEKSRNPVDIETYKHIFNKLRDKINNTAIALETQSELEEEVYLETSQTEKFESSVDYETLNSTESTGFQHIFETHAFNNSRTNSEEIQTFDFENSPVETDFTNEFLNTDDAQSCWSITKNSSRFQREKDLPNESFGFYEDDTSAVSVQSYVDIPEQASNIKKRPRNPELWQQNVRKSLYQKGLPYYDRFGVQHAGRKVGQSCVSSCIFACTKDFSYEARQRIHKNFWNLSTQEKRNFFAKYVKQVDIKRRSTKCKVQVKPRKKFSYHYFLPIAGDTIRVCKFFFLQTLAISEAKVHYYFETYHNNEREKYLLVRPGRGRKSTLQSRLLAVHEHINSFPADNTLSSAKMYELYKASTENPVGIDAYRRIRVQTLKANAENNSEQVLKSNDEPSNEEAYVETNSQSHNELRENVTVEDCENYIFTISPATNAESSLENEGNENIIQDCISSDENENENIEDSENIACEADDYKEEIVPNESEGSAIKRSSHPELWKQNIRIKRREKGLAYVDRNGVQHPAKAVGPACISTCSFLCTKHFSDKERQRIHSQFWNLTAQGKRNFYETYVEKVHIRRRSKSCRKQDDPKRKRSFHYYLPLADKSIRVCQFYFLKTLDISDAIIHYYFEKYHKDDNLETRPGPGRKKFSRIRMQEVVNHVKSYSNDKKRSAASMYKSYKETTENPVCVDLYRRVKQEILGSFKQRSSNVGNSAVQDNTTQIDPLTIEKKPSIKRTKNTNKDVEKKKKIIGPPCDESCCHSCNSKISQNERQRIHTEFWELKKEEQQDFFGDYIKTVDIKRRTKGCEVESKKQQSFSYNLPVGSKTIKVCRKYFLNTLDVSDKRLYYFFNRLKSDNY